MVKNIIFFVLMLILFIIFSRCGMFLGKDKDVGMVVTAVIYTGIMILIAYLIQLKACGEKFHFQVTPAKFCGGGEYMHQSNPECQMFYKSPEGRAQISRYSCGPTGLYKGLPKAPFKFTPLSNSLWQNERCAAPTTSLEAQGRAMFTPGVL